MFSFPVTVPIRTDESVYPMDVMIAIDEIALVKPLLDKYPENDVESDLSSEFFPASEIVFVDGRKMPVMETPATIHQYLEAYKTLDHFYTNRTPPAEKVEERGVVVPLFKASSCATSEGSIPD
jgi:hypothetical protein